MKALGTLFCAAGIILSGSIRADEPPRLPPPDRGDRYTEASNQRCSCDQGPGDQRNLRAVDRGASSETGLMVNLLLSIVIGNQQQMMMGGGPQMMMGGQQMMGGRPPMFGGQQMYSGQQMNGGQQFYGASPYSGYGSAPNYFQSSGYPGMMSNQMSAPTYLPYMASTQGGVYGVGGANYGLGGSYASSMYGTQQRSAPMMLPYRQ